MALAFALKHSEKIIEGGIRVKHIDITFDNAYPVNGWPISAADLKLKSIINVIVPAFKIGYGLEWDHVNSKIKAYQCAAAGSPMAALSTATALNAVVCRVIAIGK